MLDNCEHLIDAVAELVAFLVSAVPDLHVLTTSRAPLGIAAERVYLLGELQTDDAADLFRERAIAVGLERVIAPVRATRSFTLQVMHQSAVKSMNTGLPAALASSSLAWL